MEQSTLNRSRVIILAAAAALLLTGMLATTHSETKPVERLMALAKDSLPDTDGRGARLTLADESLPPRLIDPSAALQGGPEARLIATYRLIADHRMDEALVAAGALSRDFPTFKLAGNMISITRKTITNYFSIDLSTTSNHQS